MARLQRLEPARLVARVRGDLDWIAIKALEKDRDRRYQTVNDLAMDVQRHLDNELVSARPPSRIYRLQKLVRRHKVVFAAAAVVALVLAAGLATTTVLLVRERVLRKEQARLRLEAEHGLAVEAELRRQAEWRDGIRQVAALVYANAHADADKLLATLPSEPPTLEGSHILRTLGEWNALRGEWATAKRRFRSLLRANRFESVDDASLDLLAAAVAIVKSSDREEYAAFCRETIASAKGTNDPTIADRVLKSCLIVAPTLDLRTALKPFADVAEARLETENLATPGPNIAWRSQTLALWKLRVGQYQEAIALCDRALANGGTQSRSTGARLIRSMALVQSKQIDQARIEFAIAQRALVAKMEKPLTANGGVDGFWFDWIINDVLMRETASLLDETNGSWR